LIVCTLDFSSTVYELHNQLHWLKCTDLYPGAGFTLEMLAPIQMERSFKMPKYYGSNQIHAHILQSTQQQQTPSFHSNERWEEALFGWYLESNTCDLCKV